MIRDCRFVKITITFAQVFINVKHRNCSTDGPKHLYEEIRLARIHCTEAEQVVIFKSIQTNAFYGNPEHILLCQLCK